MEKAKGSPWRVALKLQLANKRFYQSIDTDESGSGRGDVV